MSDSDSNSNIVPYGYSESAFCTTRCSGCTGEFRCVAGDGPAPCRFLAIGERPGQEEERGGRPFIGQSGREWNENYLHLAGLD